MLGMLQRRALRVDGEGIDRLAPRALERGLDDEGFAGTQQPSASEGRTLVSAREGSTSRSVAGAASLDARAASAAAARSGATGFWKSIVASAAAKTPNCSAIGTLHLGFAAAALRAMASGMR